MRSTRALSLLLVAVLFLSTFAGLTQPAAAANPTLTLGETVSGTVAADSDVTFSFTATEAGWYAFTFGPEFKYWNVTVKYAADDSYPDRSYENGAWKGCWLDKNQTCLATLSNWESSTVSYTLSGKKLDGPTSVCLVAGGAVLKENEKWYVDDTAYLSMESTPEGYSDTFTVTTSNSGVISVNGEQLSFKSAGSAKITATTTGGISCSYTLAVIEPASVKLGQTVEGTVAANRNVQYSFTAGQAGWYAFSFGSNFSHNNISVDMSGYRTYASGQWEGGWLSKGETCVVTLDHYGDTAKSYSFTAQTLDGPTAIQISSNRKIENGQITQYVDESVSLDITSVPAGYTEKYTYTSSNEAVASCSSYSGYISCEGVGTATITVKSESGQSASVKLNVVEFPYTAISAKLEVALIEGYSISSWGSSYMIPEDLLTITLTRKDGTQESYTRAELEDTGFYVWISTDQNENPWTVGTNYATIEYNSLSAQFPVEVIKNPGVDAPKTNMQELPKELNWTKAEGYPIYTTYHGVVNVGSNVLVAGNVSSEGVLAFSQDRMHYEQQTLSSILQKLGLATATQTCSIQSIQSIDGKAYISYMTDSRAGILSTTDGKTFSNVNFPYQIYENDVFYTEEENLCSQQLYKSGSTYVLISGNQYYYTSKDLNTWTQRNYPVMDWRKGAENYHPDVNGTFVEFDFLAATDTAVYFQAWYNMGPVGETAAEGIFMTKDFVNYTCITKDLPDNGLYSTQPMNNPLENDRVAIVGRWGMNMETDYCHRIQLLIYNEQTGELKEALTSENTVDYYVYNLTGLDPVELYLEENGQSIAYYVDSTSGEVFAAHDLGLSLSTWDASVKSHHYVDSVFYYMDAAIYGNKLMFSEDYFANAFYSILPDEVAGMNVGRISPDFENNSLTLYGTQCYYTSLQPVKDQLTGVPYVKDPDMGVELMPSAPDAMKPNAQLKVEVLSKTNEAVIYDVRLMDGDREIQPEFAVYVRIPVPATVTDHTYTVYSVSASGTKTKVDAQLEEGCLQFLTDRVGKYEVQIEGPVWINPFVDVGNNDRFLPDILWALDNGITAGTDATHFSPNNNVTRGQFVMFLWRAAGEPEPTITESPFSDVQGNDRFKKAVLWALENKITAGMSDGTFGLNKPCTRGQVVMFLYRFAGKPDFEITHENFPDVSPNDSYYKAVMWAREMGITGGQSDGNFGLNGTCKRVHAVAFLHRFLG